MLLDYMEIPRYVVMGPKALEHIPGVCSKLGFRGLGYIVSGSTFTRRIAEEVLSLLEEGGFKAVAVIVSGNPRCDGFIEEIRSIYRDAKKGGARFIVGVGGGTVLDTAKLISSWLNAPFVSIPTSTAHDGIASPAVSFLLRYRLSMCSEGEVKISAPMAIVADIDVIKDEPYHMVVAGFGDLIAKYTAVKDWRLAVRERGEEYSEYAASMSLMSANLSSRHASSIKDKSVYGIRVLVKALIGSGVAMSIAGSSRPASGSEHLFSHALDLLSFKHGFEPRSHGVQCGVGSIVAMYLHGGDWMRIRNLLLSVKAPVDSKTLGIDEEYLVEALIEASRIRPERFTILSKIKPDRGVAEDILTKALVI
ncbi:MAG: sn-glycerol-1-phosphate dehydrogenase [Candidatus Bathyarchaeota archaeon]|nr:sn-glycerol-1-phosphate dehydrogenase [Candidatus Bathyarchaeota archaeon]